MRILGGTPFKKWGKPSQEQISRFNERRKTYNESSYASGTADYFRKMKEINSPEYHRKHGIRPFSDIKPSIYMGLKPGSKVNFGPPPVDKAIPLVKTLEN